MSSGGLFAGTADTEARGSDNGGDMDNNDIRLYNEDCMEVLKRLPDNSVDLIVTDPPYLIEKSSGGGQHGA